MNDLYIKLRIDILEDPRAAMLPDHKWRKMIELALLEPSNWHCDPKPQRHAWNLKWKNIRKQVFERDPHKCKQCGSTDNLVIDHLIPLARGGTNDLDNLQILCKSCNRKKAAKL